MRIMRIESNVNVCRSTLATFDLELEVDTVVDMIKEHYIEDGEDRDYITNDEIEGWVLNNCTFEDIIYMMTDASKEKVEACYKLFNNGDKMDYMETYVVHVLEEYDNITFTEE